MKLKDLDKSTELIGMYIFIPNKIKIEQLIPRSKMMIHSGWNRGLWLKVDHSSERIYPLCFEDISEIEDFEIKGR